MKALIYFNKYQNQAEVPGALKDFPNLPVSRSENNLVFFSKIIEYNSTCTKMTAAYIFSKYNPTAQCVSKKWQYFNVHEKLSKNKVLYFLNRTRKDRNLHHISKGITYFGCKTIKSVAFLKFMQVRSKCRRNTM